MNRTTIWVGLALVGSLLCGSSVSAVDYENWKTIGGTENSAVLGRSETYATIVSQRLVMTDRSSWLCGVEWELKKSGSPTDQLLLSVYHGGTDGGESGTAIVNHFAPSQVYDPDPPTGADVSSSTWTYQYFGFNTCVPLLYGETYWITLQRSGGASDTNYYNVRYGTADGGSNYGRWSYVPTNGTWTTSSGEWSVRLYGIQDSPELVELENLASRSNYGTTDYGFLGNSLRDVAIFLFVPGRSTMLAWKTFQDELESNIPFSYLTDVYDAFSDISTASHEFMEVDVVLPPMFTTSSISMTLISSASFYTWVDASTWGTVRGITTVLIWCSLVFYVWRRVRGVFSNTT